MANGVGETTFFLSNGAETRMRFQRVSSNVDLTISNLSAKLVPGYPAIQASVGLRPLVQLVNSRYVAQGDGLDDFQAARNPTAAMTLIALGTPGAGAAGDAIIGSQAASDGKAYLGLNGSGHLGGGVGSQTTSTIVDQNPVDLRGVRCCKVLRYDESTVSLFVKTATTPLRKAYEAAQSGAANTTVPLYLFALNNNNVSAANADYAAEDIIMIPSAPNDARIAQIVNSLL
jgi:hypothetical protein